MPDFFFLLGVNIAGLMAGRGYTALHLSSPKPVKPTVYGELARYMPLPSVTCAWVRIHAQNADACMRRGTITPYARQRRVRGRCRAPLSITNVLYNRNRSKSSIEKRKEKKVLSRNYQPDNTVCWTLYLH